MAGPAHRPVTRAVPEDRGELGFETIARSRVAVEQQEGPGQRERCRLVSREQQRHDLVADLALGHSGALLIAREEQHREQVAAVLARAALADDPVDDIVETPGRLPSWRLPGVGSHVGMRNRRLAKRR